MPLATLRLAANNSGTLDTGGVPHLGNADVEAQDEDVVALEQILDACDDIGDAVEEKCHPRSEVQGA